MLAIPVIFLRFLIVAAGRKQDMPPFRRGVPARACRLGTPAGGCRLGFGQRNKERLDRPAAEVGRGTADDRVDLPRARAGVATVENHGDMRPLGRHVTDQLGNLFISQIPASWVPAIEAHEGLIQVVWLELPELLGGLLLRAVTAVIEERDVTFCRLAQVAAEGINDRLAGGLAVLERLQFQCDALVLGHALREVSRKGVDVVDAAPKLWDRAGIVVDGDQKSIDRARHGRGLLRGKREAIRPSR